MAGFYADLFDLRLPAHLRWHVKRTLSAIVVTSVLARPLPALLRWHGLCRFVKRLGWSLKHLGHCRVFV